jgi:crotonobetainyl-CoA:carnitine CoA-transferase CaiB-like acyl-CoA transferase
VKLSGTPLGEALTPGAVLRLTGYVPPAYEGIPATGEHTWDVLAEDLGISREAFQSLVRAGVVREP